MFKNPLKYQSGGVTQSKEQEAENQLVSAIAEGLGAQPEQVKARLEQIKSNPNEVKELQSALQLMQQDQNAGFQAVLKLFAKPQSAKHGAKIQDFICKHKRGGYVAGCGCKEDGGIVKGQEGIPSINGYRVFPRTWQNNLDGSTSSEQIAVEPNGQAIQRVIIDRSRMTNRDELPIRDTLRLGGYYTPDGFIQDGDITFGREIDPIFDTVNKKKVVKNQEPAGPIPEPDDSYFGTISEDTTNPIRRWIDNKINNNPTLYRTRQGLRNFAQSAPGKVLDFFVPDITSESGALAATAPGFKFKTPYIPKYIREMYPNDKVAQIQSAYNHSVAKPVKMRDTFSELYNKTTGHTGPLLDVLIEKQGGKVESADNGAKVNKKNKTVTNVNSGLSKYDAEKLGLDPNTLVDTGSTITAYPNKKPYIVNGQVPFNKRNAIWFSLGGVESGPVEDGANIGGVPGRKYRVSQVGGQETNYGEYSNPEPYPYIIRYASPVDTMYNVGFTGYNNKSIAYPGIRALYNAAIDSGNIVAQDEASHKELQRQKSERKQNK